MHKVQLYFIKQQADKNWSETNKSLTDQWLLELSSEKRASIQRLRNESDRLSSLLGLRLLKLCALDEKLTQFQLQDVQYPETGKPFWRSQSNDNYDFNISHSDNLIVVAASRTLRVGVDVEKIRKLKNLNFKMVMRPEELTQIRQTPDLFFNLWSMKEAVVKAANTTGIARMRDVQLDEEQAILDGLCWYTKAVDKLLGMEGQFAIHLATSQLPGELIIKQMTLDGLMSY